MSISSGFLKKVDFWSWRPVTAAISLLKLFTYRRKLDPKTAIVRPGGLGDLVLLIIAMKRSGINLQDYVFFIQARSEPWAAYLKINYVVVDKHPLSLFKYLGSFSKVINTEQFFGLATSFSVLLTKLGGNICGFRSNRGLAYFSSVIDYHNSEVHEADAFSQFFPNEVQNKISKTTAAENYTCLSISGVESPTRNLSAEEWVRLVETYAAGTEVRILNSPVERALAVEINKILLKKGFTSSLCTGGFSTQVEVLRHANLLLGMDGGMLHVASYFDVRTHAIFTSSQDQKWAPLANGSKVIRRRDLSCQPCAVFAQVPPCPNGFKCRDVEEIIKQNRL